MKTLLNTPLNQLSGRSHENGLNEKILSFLTSRQNRDQQFVRDLISQERLIDIVESGLRICESQPTKKNKKLIENYYYITQHFTAGAMQDHKDLKNRPWLLIIRGQKDFHAFVKTINNHNQLKDAGDINLTPNQILQSSYNEYKTNLPAWPGIYDLNQPQNQIDQSCDQNSSMLKDFLHTTAEIVGGPLAQKDGKNFFSNKDFWRIYYCPSQN